MADAESRLVSDQLSHVFSEILRLQPAWSSSNTPEMKLRGTLVRHEGPPLVKVLLQSAFTEEPFDMGVEGRDGTGLKTRVPWIRVYSRSRSPRATDGWYVAYLFAFDGSAVYLSLNQGTTVPGQFTMRPPEQLEARVRWAHEMLKRSGIDLAGLAQKIDLADRGLGRGYERGNVLAIRYDPKPLQGSGSIVADLKRMVELLKVLYDSSSDTEPKTSSDLVESAINPRPPLTDLPAFVAWVRYQYGTTMVSSRQESEQEARELLNNFAGSMTAEQALHLGELFNTGEWGGVLRHNRFSPAFVGATMQRVIEPLDEFNDWTNRLWRRSEAEALQLVDEILRNAQAFPGAGRSYPTMLMYLRNPARFVIWLQITHRGLAAIGRLDESHTRIGGTDRYFRYCAAAQKIADEFKLAPQEIDAVLVEAARASADESGNAAAEIASLVADESDELSDEKGVRPEYPLTHVAAVTHLPLEQLEEWAALLRGKKRQALFYGPPGTGKTFVAEQLARHLVGVDGEIELVQFHPSFCYEDFIEGLRPENLAGGAIGYKVRPGVFKMFCDRARQNEGTNVFIIDEMNRAELGAVIGELMILLEYRGKHLVLPYSQEQFSVPANVVILATMNTADRSLALVDFALRRRFHAFEMRPDKDVLKRYMANRLEQAELVLEFFNVVQSSVDNSDFSPGHSYWMVEDLTAQGLYRVWRYELLPYLAEYWFEHRSHLRDLDTRVAKLLSEGA